MIAKVNGKTITEADMKLAEAEIGTDLGSLPEATKRRVLVEYLIENQLFADAAEGEKLGLRRRLRRAHAVLAAARAARRLLRQDRQGQRSATRTRSKFYDSQVAALKPEEEVRARHILVESEEKAQGDRSRRSRTAPTSPSSPRRTPRTPARKDEGGELGYFGARPDGAAVRGGRLQAAEGRGVAAVQDPVRLAHHQGRGSPPASAAALRGGQGPHHGVA